MILLVLFINNIISTGDIKFHIDHTIFRSESTNVTAVEFYYAIPFEELIYKVQAETIFSQYQTTLKIRNLNLPDSLSEIKENRFIIPSFRYARAHNLRVLDRLTYFLKPGEYEYEFTIQCSTKIGSTSDRFTVGDDSLKFKISSLLLAHNIIPDTTPNLFNKNNFLIIPNPECRYQAPGKTLFGYIEIYGDSVGGDYLINYRVVNLKGETVKMMEYREARISKSQTHIWRMNIGNLEPGDYILTVDIKDLMSGQVAQTSKRFSVVKEKITPYRPVEVVRGKYYRAIKYLVSEKEYKKFLSYSAEGQEAYLSNFWKQNNYEEFESRIEYANEFFSIGPKKGMDTDRGRIYIKYGPPDEKISHTFETGYRPNEHWIYYNTGYHFIFVDIKQNSDYELIYSSTNKERTDPNWERYINPDELKSLE